MGEAVLTNLAAALVYLIPVAVVLLAASFRERPLAQLGADIPFAVAADLLSVLVLTHLVTLETAVLLSRAAWIAGGGGWLWYRRKRAPLHRPVGLTAVTAGLLAGAGAGALGLSLWLSRPYAIWDRQWHIPLVASLRGQRLPFVNVYQPHLELAYHFSGDVLAAMLQTLSAAHLHSSQALSLAHDLLFLLIGIAIAAPLAQRTQRAWVMAAPLGVLLIGPLTFHSGWLGHRNLGFSFLNLYQMSYRPHVALGILGIVGIVSCLWLRVPTAGEPIPPRRFLLKLATIAAALAITDEPSIVILGFGLTAVWLAAPKVLASTRWGGLATLAALPIIFVLANIFISTTLRSSLPGRMALVAPRLPSLVYQPLSLAKPITAFILLMDTAPLWSSLALLTWLGRRAPSDAILTTRILLATVLGVSVVLLCCLEVMASPGEGHRFMTLPMVLFPLATLHFADRLAISRRLVAWVAATLLVPAGCSLVWAAVEPLHDFAPNKYAAEMHTLSCRSAAGARLFESAQPMYISPTAFFLFAGCHPVFTPGTWPRDSLDVGRPATGVAALAKLRTDFLKPGAPLRFVCDTSKAGANDAICGMARLHGRCLSAGPTLVDCVIPTMADRPRRTGSEPAPPPPRPRPP